MYHQPVSMFINSRAILFHLSLQLLSPPINIILKPVPDFVISSINVLVHVCISEREDLTFFETESFSHAQTNHSNNCSLMSLAKTQVSNRLTNLTQFPPFSSLFSALDHIGLLGIFWHFWWSSASGPLHTGCSHSPPPSPRWAHGSHSHRPLLKHHSYCREERQDSRLLGTPFVL